MIITFFHLFKKALCIHWWFCWLLNSVWSAFYCINLKTKTKKNIKISLFYYLLGSSAQRLAMWSIVDQGLSLAKGFRNHIKWNSKKAAGRDRNMYPQWLLSCLLLKTLLVVFWERRGWIRWYQAAILCMTTSHNTLSGFVKI